MIILSVVLTDGHHMYIRTFYSSDVGEDALGSNVIAMLHAHLSEHPDEEIVSHIYPVYTIPYWEDSDGS